MAKTKTKPDDKLYARLRDSGVRKKVASKAAKALPTKGRSKPSRAQGIADELTKAADSIRERAGGGSRKRSKAAKKAARTRKANAAKRRSSARKGAKTRSKS
ncbi:MAG: hypothetical protein M3355_05035 [Actinomycetota bacterium]|nr:hypothetical protein [Actinomycetota bacterium]